MIKHLMNGDKHVLDFDIEEGVINVINNDYLPFELKDYIETTNTDNFKKAVHDLSVLKDYLANRTLNLSRDNAKTILNVTALPQSLKTDDRLKIVFACKGLSMTDNFWIKEDNEDICFSDVNLRKIHLSDASYDIAILGHHISATAEELRPDLSTAGMFPKYWHRENDVVYMYKTDNFIGNPNTLAELEASRIIREAGGNVVDYIKKEKDDRVFSCSRCISDDKYSLVSASAIKDWCDHTDQNFKEFINSFVFDFANMVIADYVVANTDRHIDNWGFIVDNDKNDIYSFAPNFDLNQSLIADKFGTNIDNLIYEPTGKTFLESVKDYALLSSLNFENIQMSSECENRAKAVAFVKIACVVKEKVQNDYTDDIIKLIYDNYGSEFLITPENEKDIIINKAINDILTCKNKEKHIDSLQINNR